MQNVQNAAEIQQRVINLVELYRTKVGRESQIAKDAREEYESLSEMGIWAEGDHTERWIKLLHVNGQLLGHFYAEVVGEDADKTILGQLLPELYDKTVYTEEEEAFLKSHFQELVNYIIKTPSDNEYLKWVMRNDELDRFVIPDEVMNLIVSRANIAEGSKIFYPNAGLAQLINQFEGCKFYCDKKNVWMQLAILANNADVEILEDGVLPSLYDYVVSYAYGVLDEAPTYNMGKEDKCTKTLISAYEHLNDGGRMILLCPNELLWSMYPHDLDFFTKDDKGNMNKVLNPIRDIHYEFRHRLMEDGSIVEIIQLPNVMSSNANTRDYSLLIVEKGRTEGVLSMIDARYAFKETKKTNFSKILDLNAFNSMLQNHGCDTETGLRKMVEVSTSDLDEQMMIPQVYVIERPSENEHPVPLSSLCQLVTERVRDVEFDLPLDTPWVKFQDLSETFRGALEPAHLDKANCPNRPSNKKVKDLTGVGSILYYLSVDGNASPEDFHIAQYRACTYLNGSKDAVLFGVNNEGIKSALLRATGKPVVIGGDSFIGEGVLILYPTSDMDALSLLSILRMPIVYRQILAYKEYGLNGELGHLKDILVPTDKRTIGDELFRMKMEKSLIDELGDKVQAMKTEYINDVRMRKHDMRPYLRQLASSERLMLYYINNIGNMDDLKKNLKKQLEHSQSALANLSTIVEHLSDEEKFGESEMFNIDEILSDIEVNHDEGEGFVIEYDCDNDSFRNSGIKILNIAEQWEKAREQGLDMAKFIKTKAKEKLPLFINIATVDFQRLVTNIIENARRHGFTDKTRQDYYIGIELSYNSERGMYQIDFSNNGNPLPEGMTKSRYGIRGEKAGLTAGTGSGGYIVKSIVNHYNGDYDIFCNDEITTVRILLPIATI